jgi:RNA polymerase sigma factor (sigma-70 family)
VIQGETKAKAAAETVAGYEHLLKRTARRYSLDGEDVEDAYQRTLEIVLTKAPTSDPQELIRWAQTVIKHEALAVRRNRERLLGVAPVSGEGMPRDPVAQLPARGDGPAEQAERREEVARTREALQALKPAELRTLTLLAEGYSYAEMAQITGFSLTKVNRPVLPRPLPLAPRRESRSASRPPAGRRDRQPRVGRRRAAFPAGAP